MISSGTPNRTLAILNDAERHGYGVLAAIVYNVEHITAYINAAEAQRSPLIILLFPSTLRQVPSLVWAADAASRSATVPVSVHLDHAQDETQIREVVETLPFDSIMVDMSHYDHKENLEKTKKLTSLCHSKSIAVEGECGRINGGEDGISDTGDLEALFTTPEEVEDFLEAGVDMLAPSVGNIHGDYPPRGPQLDFARLASINKQLSGRSLPVLHGTNDFSPEIIKACISAGVVKLNVNKLLLECWSEWIKKNVNKPLSAVMTGGIEVLQSEVERWMVICGSSGRAKRN